MKTHETPELRRLRALVEVKKAEAEIAQMELTEELKKQWEKQPLEIVLSKLPNQAGLMILTDFDWKDGRFEYAAELFNDNGRKIIGGYPDNDRFRGLEDVYVHTNQQPHYR